MSTTLLRLGLWTLILVLALFVIAETYHEEHWTEMIPRAMLAQVLAVSVAVRVKNRCRVCRTPIVQGALYCREHLRNILADEDEKTHMTKVRRR
jgi:predicted nucleic acid-binding Zn ribbon protein